MANEIKLCPDSPNCVSSRPDEDVSKFVEPIVYTSALEEVQKRLEAVINEYGGTSFLKKESQYWHVVFTTKLLRFKDDVEFLFEADKKRIMIRSASRVGHYDFGANKKRIQKIRAALL